MPVKQTRERIEAELNAGQRERIVERFKKFIDDLDIMETELREIETARGIYDAAGRPLAERMEAVGLDRSAAMAREALDAMTKAALGRVDEIPEHLKRDLARMADAEISALDQLQDILDARRRR